MSSVLPWWAVLPNSTPCLLDYVSCYNQAISSIKHMDKKNQEVTTEELAEMKTEILENFRALRQDMSGQFSSFLNSIRKDFRERLDQVEEDVQTLQLHQ